MSDLNTVEWVTLVLLGGVLATFLVYSIGILISQFMWDFDEGNGVHQRYDASISHKRRANAKYGTSSFQVVPLTGAIKLRDYNDECKVKIGRIKTTQLVHHYSTSCDGYVPTVDDSNEEVCHWLKLQLALNNERFVFDMRYPTGHSVIISDFEIVDGKGVSLPEEVRNSLDLSDVDSGVVGLINTSEYLTSPRPSNRVLKVIGNVLSRMASPY